MKAILYPLAFVSAISMTLQFVVMLFALREYNTCLDDLCRTVTTNARLLLLELTPVTFGSLGLGIAIEKLKGGD